MLILKLAAMGDVALACRALNDFASDVGLPKSQTIYWVIDQALEPLARRLLNVDVEFLKVNSASLFKGSPFEKMELVGEIGRYIWQKKPQRLVFLHRNARYKLLFAAAPFARKVQIQQNAEHEYQAYYKGFLEAWEFPFSERVVSPAVEAVRPSKTRQKIGILVGGAKNQKVFFSEKRWPHLEEFVRLCSECHEVLLFGGKEDSNDAQKLIEAVGSPQVLNMAGSYALEALPGELEKLDVFVSIDSGLGHLAAQTMDQPHQRVFSLFGPTDPKIWAPLAAGKGRVKVFYKGPPCSPCYRNDGDFRSCRFDAELRQHCMKDISAKEVFSEL